MEPKASKIIVDTARSMTVCERSMHQVLVIEAGMAIARSLIKAGVGEVQALEMAGEAMDEIYCLHDMLHQAQSREVLA